MTYTLNILDLLFTLYALSNGAVELNPLMRCIPVQIFCKIVVAGAACWWLDAMAKVHRSARVGRMVCAAAYGAVVQWHVYNLAIAWIANKKF